MRNAFNIWSHQTGKYHIFRHIALNEISWDMKQNEILQDLQEEEITFIIEITTVQQLLV